MYLKNTNFRNYGLFKVQLNTGLRISDVVKLKYDDVFEKNGNIKKHLSLTEKKQKRTDLYLSIMSLEPPLKSLKTILSIKILCIYLQAVKGKIDPLQRHRYIVYIKT